MAAAGAGSVQPDGAGLTTAMLERIDQVFATAVLPGAPDIAELRPAIRRRTLAVLDMDREPQAQHGRFALLFYTADLLATQAIELAAYRERAIELIDRLTEVAGLSRQALAREVLRSHLLLGFPPPVAVEVQLGLLMAFAPLRDVSLWMADDDGAVRPVCHVGEQMRGSAQGELARTVLSGKAPLAERGALLGLAVKRWHEHAGALIARPTRGTREQCAAVLAEAVPMLGPLLEREMLIARNAAAERTLTDTYERRLKRLGFDIHDGPLQDLALLGEDVQLLRRQLSDVLDEGLRTIMLGRLDDVHAQLAALDSSLRRVSGSLQSPLGENRSLREEIENVVRLFAARSKISPTLDIDGELDELTDSQQMALLSITREALSNVREHSDASEVAISLRGAPMAIELHVRDNGRGFDVERTLMRAARDGHFGVAGMHERARLLGGTTQIDSKPGQPTEISVMLPRWRRVVQRDRDK